MTMRKTAALVLFGWMVSGCADPLADFARPADVDLAPTEPAAAVVEAPSEQQPSLLGRLLNRPEQEAAKPEAPVTVEATPPAAPAAPETTAEVIAETAATETATVAPQAEAPAAAPIQPRRAGFFGLFGGRRAAAVPDPSREPGVISRVAETTVATPVATGPDQASVAPGQNVPFGQIANACGMRGRNLGRKIDSQAGFALYDSAPGSIKSRPHYITGFKDGCPRQFTAALALMGDPQGYELVEFARAHKGTTPVDTAFDDIRARVCRSRPGQPCGRRIRQLARNTRFVTAYATTAPSSRWTDILLHNSSVAAIGQRTP